MSSFLLYAIRVKNGIICSRINPYNERKTDANFIYRM